MRKDARGKPLALPVMAKLCAIAWLALCREAAIKPAARRTCDKFELMHDAAIDGVWGPGPQKNLL